ncbi:hypothetical protein ACJX0J_029600, partial [Zea mays]
RLHLLHNLKKNSKSDEGDLLFSLWGLSACPVFINEVRFIDFHLFFFEMVVSDQKYRSYFVTKNYNVENNTGRITMDIWRDAPNTYPSKGYIHNSDKHDLAVTTKQQYIHNNYILWWNVGCKTFGKDNIRKKVLMGLAHECYLFGTRVKKRGGTRVKSLWGLSACLCLFLTFV